MKHNEILSYFTPIYGAFKLIFKPLKGIQREEIIGFIIWHLVFFSQLGILLYIAIKFLIEYLSKLL